MYHYHVKNILSTVIFIRFGIFIDAAIAPVKNIHGKV